MRPSMFGMDQNKSYEIWRRECLDMHKYKRWYTLYLSVFGARYLNGVFKTYKSLADYFFVGAAKIPTI